ncbi:hypothetical protein BDZ45DRAFT_752938 [Acephala macrosclerotiorum]|nr:hypothetical protein BDZ45DRAFT_752938 [Acephala macrosclerotiorum]
MLSNPFSRPARTIFLFVVLLVGMIYYRPAHRLPHGFPHLDTETLHQYLNRSEHAQKPLALMSKLQKQLQFSECVECVPETKVVSSIQHHYRTETKTKTVSATTTTTSIIRPTCEANIGGPMSSIKDVTLEQQTITKLRDQGIVIIFKTGAQEVSHLAIQVGTTLRYLSSNDILFFSDQQGSIGPFLINDALRNVNQSLKNDHPDFEIYRKIKEYQSTGQDIEELQEDKTKGNSRSGWKLDKYKFIHMIEESFEMRPDAKWYVFIETDSYVFWDNLAEWLKRFDSAKPWYIGSRVEHGGVQFAHGGSGYILSNAAMNKLLGPDQPQGLAASWDARMKDTPYGDKAVGIALKEKGVLLSVAHPMMNGYKPSTFTYGPKNHWCQPVVTMHHIMPHEVSNVWRYERQREMLGMANTTLFADLYFHFVEPHLVDSRDNWDNLSHGPTYSQQKVDIEEKQRKELEIIKQTKKKEAEKKQKENETGDEKTDGEVGKGKGTAAGDKTEPNPETKVQNEGKEDATPKNTLTAKDDEGQKKEDAKEDKISKEKDTGKESSKMDVKEASLDRDKEDSTASEKIKSRVPSILLVKREDSKRLKDAQSHAHESFEKCGKLCEESPDCFQWVYCSETCKLGMSFRLGKYVKPSDDRKVVWKSGWLVPRVRKWTAENACTKPVWLDL